MSADAGVLMVEQAQGHRRTITAWLGMKSRARRSEGNLRWALGNEYYFDGYGFWPDEVEDLREMVKARHAARPKGSHQQGD